MWKGLRSQVCRLASTRLQVLAFRPSPPTSNVRRSTTHDLFVHLRRAYSSSKRTKGPRRHWSEAEHKKLLDLRSQNRTIREIALYFPSRSESAVQAHITALLLENPSLPRRHRRLYNDEDIQQLRTLKRGGKSLAAAQAKFPHTVSRDLRNLLDRSNNADGHKKGPYTKEEDDQLLALVAQQTITFANVSMQMNRSLNSVHSRYCKLVSRSDRPPRTKLGGVTPDEKRQILDMHEMGMSVKQIAGSVGRTYSTVYRSTIPSSAERQYHYTEAEDNALLSLRAQGVKFVDIARTLSRPHGPLTIRLEYLQDCQRLGQKVEYLSPAPGNDTTHLQSDSPT